MKIQYLVSLGAAAILMADAARGVNLDPGWAAYKSGDYAKAYDLFLAKFRDDPANLEVNYALGQAAYRNKKYSHAVFAYERVLMAEPDHEKALLGKAQAQLALGQFEEARAAFAAVRSMTSDAAVRDEALSGLKAVAGALPKFDLSGNVYLSAIYDDNVNYGDDKNLFPGVPSKETAGFEGGVNLRGTYDLGPQQTWQLIGGINVFDSWYEGANGQEMADLRGYAGVRRTNDKTLLEIAGRIEHLWYGQSNLVDICGSDMAFMMGLSNTDWLTTTLTVEQRDYDAAFDTFGARDSIFLMLGESWKHFYGSHSYISVGADLLREDAESGAFSYTGGRIRVDGQAELANAVCVYAGGRYRLMQYDDPGVAATDEREDDRFDLFIGAKRYITDRLLLDLRYLYVQNNSNNGNEYERNRLNLTATFEF